QAEDGIRDFHVTGVQTCALPISRRQWPTGADRLGVPATGRIGAGEQAAEGRALARLTDLGWGGALREIFAAGAPDAPVSPQVLRSEERRVGKGCRSRWGRRAGAT